MLYDIIQVEDDSDSREFLERFAQRQSLSYLGVGYLDALRDALKEHSAKVYIVDGSFPDVEGGNEKGNGFVSAIELIRDRYADAQIILHSGQWDTEDHAEELGVVAMNKLRYVAKDAVAKVKEMMN